MNGGTALAILLVLSVLRAPVRAAETNGTIAPVGGPVERHHYTMNARVRPVLVFWISREDVGDAVIERTERSGTLAYSLLIGSDPDKAPRHINRWGYIEEQVRDGQATLLGLMTQSDEESVKEADASVARQQGHQTFKLIRASVVNGEARSEVSTVLARDDYSLRSLGTVLELAKGVAGADTNRVLKLAPGTRPGFLVAVADAMHRQTASWRATRSTSKPEPIPFVYHGKLYRLSVAQARAVTSVRIGQATYQHVIEAQFQLENQQDGTASEFSMTFATEGPLADMPLAITYRPRWWIEVQLTLDDRTPGPTPARVLDR